MKLLAIDPGPNQSGWVVTDGTVIPEIIDFGITETVDLVSMIDAAVVFGKRRPDDYYMAIETVASYGMAVGESVFETCFQIGKLLHAFGGASEKSCTKIYRKDVKICLCHNMRAKDKNIRQAILDLYPKTGGGKIPQIGVKKQPGPLFGVSSHVWAAIGVAITWANQRKIKEVTK